MGAFEDTWLRRIGPEATAELRRNGHLTLVFGPTTLLLAILCSFLFGSGKAVEIGFGFFAVGTGLALWWIWMRSRRRLGIALSRHFGVKIGGMELPRMTAPQFDAWCRKKNLSMPSDSG